MLRTFAATAPSAIPTRTASPSAWPSGAVGFEDRAGDEDAEAGEEPDAAPLDRRRQVAAVVGRVRIPPSDVAVGDEEREDERRRGSACGDRCAVVEAGAE